MKTTPKLSRHTTRQDLFQWITKLAHGTITTDDVDLCKELAAAARGMAEFEDLRSEVINLAVDPVDFVNAIDDAINVEPTHTVTLGGGSLHTIDLDPRKEKK